MKMIIIFLSVVVSPIVFAADWNSLNGIYAVTSLGYLDPSDNEQKDSHYRFQLTGKSAKDLYMAMKVKPITDDCTGGMAKNIGDMQCLYFKDGPKYDCHFSINIAKQQIEYGVAC